MPANNLEIREEPIHTSLSVADEPELWRDGERLRKFSEHGYKIRTDAVNRSDDYDGDESGDQTILDGGDAGFVSDETREEGLHRKLAPVTDGAIVSVTQIGTMNSD